MDGIPLNCKSLNSIALETLVWPLYLGRDTAQKPIFKIPRTSDAQSQRFKLVQYTQHSCCDLERWDSASLVSGVLKNRGMERNFNDEYVENMYMYLESKSIYICDSRHTYSVWSRRKVQIQTAW